ncbi:MAG: fumarylacetoacetate hydrolase family protein [bacterium]|nr:fumarylacetoacetate hydrolase family protein [bacterium]
MRLVTFTHSGRTRIGVQRGDEIVDLSAAAPALPSEMSALFAAGETALQTASNASGPTLALGEIELEAPIQRPPKILAVGLNYADHIAETGRDTPKVPLVFNKQSTAIIGPGQAIHRPKVSEQLDYEAELVIVIGRRCRHVPGNRAHEVIAGYTIGNDVSVRDWQDRVQTMTMGKSFDTHAPIGPAIVTHEEIGAASAYDIRCWVNGELRQESNTRELVFDAEAIIEHLSTAFTLEPGDLIFTGTPGGVAHYMQPPAWLKPGDVCRVEIEGIGALENPVIDEPENTRLI